MNFIVCELQLDFFVKWGKPLGRLEVLWRWMMVMVKQQYEYTLCHLIAHLKLKR